MTILVQEFEQIPMILKVTHDFKGLSDLPIEVGVLGKMTFYRFPETLRRKITVHKEDRAMPPHRSQTL